MTDHISHEGVDSQINWMASCKADACQQGRNQCPCPEACAVPTKERLGPVKRWERWTIKNPGSTVYLLMAFAGFCTLVITFSVSVVADVIAWGFA